MIDEELLIYDTKVLVIVTEIFHFRLILFKVLYYFLFKNIRIIE